MGKVIFFWNVKNNVLARGDAQYTLRFKQIQNQVGGDDENYDFDDGDANNAKLHLNDRRKPKTISSKFLVFLFLVQIRYSGSCIISMFWLI